MRGAAGSAVVAALLATTTLASGRAQAQATSTEATPQPTTQTTPQATGSSADQSSDIVVTAQRREERSRDVPISVTTLNPTQLAAANVNTLTDTAKLTTALRFDAQGTFVQPSIRGVGTAITTSGGGPNVGIYVDGFFQSNSEVADFQLTRLRSIQVLKGPQGTLFGRNTTGGAILVTTADPATDPEAEFKASYGRFNALTLQGYGTVGLGQKVALDVEGLYRHGDGFNRNIVGNDRKVGRYEDWTVRTGLKLDVTDDVSVLVRYTHSRTDDPTALLTAAAVDETGDARFFDDLSPAGRAAYGRTSSKGQPLVYFYTPAGQSTTTPGEVAESQKVSFRSTSDTVQGTIKADLGFADLTSYTQYRRDASFNREDLDAIALQLFQIGIDVHDTTVSQEFLLNSKAGSRLQWTAGLNYYQNRDIWDISASFGTPYLPFGGSGTNSRSYAAFADATYQLTDRLFLTGGARYSHDVVADAYFRTNFTTTSYVDRNGNTVLTPGIAPGTTIPVPDLVNNRLTPRVVLRFKPTTASSIYASFTRGYKAGILNVGGFSANPVKHEVIDAYEVGYKYADRRFSLDLAGYYYDYSNLQVSSFQNGTANITNAASARIYGIEGQFSYALTRGVNVYGGAAWTHARYRSFRNAPFYTYCDPVAPRDPSLACGAIGPGSLTQTTTDASGGQMQRAPDFTANLGASDGFDLARGRVTLSANGSYSSSFFFDPSQQFHEGAYATLALRAQWVDPTRRFTLAAFGDNVTNTRYRTQVQFNTLGIGAVWNSPAVYGVSVGVRI